MYLISFWVLCALKSWSKYFFWGHFQPFWFILDLFQWFHVRNQEKVCENEQKKHCFCYSSELADSLRRYVKIGPKKVFWPALGYVQHPESWSKYTTERIQSTFQYRNQLNDGLVRVQSCKYVPIHIQTAQSKIMQNSPSFEFACGCSWEKIAYADSNFCICSFTVFSLLWIVQ